MVPNTYLIAIVWPNKALATLSINPKLLVTKQLTAETNNLYTTRRFEAVCIAVAGFFFAGAITADLYFYLRFGNLIFDKLELASYSTRK